MGNAGANHRRGKEGFKKRFLFNTKTPFSQLSYKISHPLYCSKFKGILNSDVRRVFVLFCFILISFLFFSVSKASESLL